MSKVIVEFSMSLDGFTAHPDGRTDEVHARHGPARYRHRLRVGFQQLRTLHHGIPAPLPTESGAVPKTGAIVVRMSVVTISKALPSAENAD